MSEFHITESEPAPRRRDAASTRRKLLIAARQEFARNGLAGARVVDIAAQAGVNKQLVYHYFGDKDAIYSAVLEWIYDEIRRYGNALKLQGLSPDRAIRKLIESSFDYLAGHPDFILLLNDENRSGATRAQASIRLTEMNSPLPGMIAKTLAQGVRAGIFRKGINATQLFISIAGLSYFYFSGMPALSAFLKKDLATTAALRMRRRHVVDLVMQSLRA